MYVRPFRPISALLLSFVAVTGLAATALAAPKDKAAMKLHDAAMNEDYLNVDFAKAEKKLSDAIKLCGANGCSPDVLGKLHVSLGTVLGIGQNKMDAAKAEFQAALKADPNAQLDKSLSTPQLQATFDEAKGGGGEKPPPTKKGPGGDLPMTPPPESPVNTPVPIYIDVPSDLSPGKVTLRYKPFGGTSWKSLEMRKMGDGYGAEIPCEDTTTTGEIKFYITVADTDGAPIATAGTLKEPYRVTVKNELDGEAPHLPGKKPPKQCAAKGECPPGLPGCAEAGGPQRGDKAEGATCDTTTECQAGLTCLNGTCAPEAGGGGAKGKPKKNVIGAYAQFDLTLYGSKAPGGGSAGVCDVSNSNSYACFYTGTSHEFYGAPDDGVANTDSVAGGFAFAGMRALVGYDRQLLSKVPLSLGLRFGVAFPSMPSPDNAPQGRAGPTGLNWAPVSGFPPIHAEGRLTYSLGGALFEGGKAHPYFFVGGGVARVTTSVQVQVCDQLTEGGEFVPTPSKVCRGGGSRNSRPVTLDAYQIEGLNFVAVGAGTNYGITDNFGIAAELKIMFMVPTFGVVFSPTLGPVVAF
ncbi:MAG TPA: hypothetical protein VHB21_09115 [Minicystis sp.]|nr:hypothetical protein [Minicystis sp.]